MQLKNTKTAELKDKYWVFGYGSLIWKQDFPYQDIQPAYIKGWSRRLWQGSHDHRGTPDNPGRVATIIRTPAASCAGVAVSINKRVFDHLDYREKNGYERHQVEIFLADRMVTGTTYVGSPDNHAFFGEASDEAIIAQVMRSAGESGENLDYLLALAESLCELKIKDEHIGRLASKVRRLMRSS
ncbi:MAG: gamma-glutamylcyclotransferase [Woeseiaceae bacterium]